jgi:peptidoglycan-N-acetylglucosamine deacetylase
VVALTFDDGPGPYSPPVVRVLRRLHAPATFFEAGFMPRWFHASAARQVADGFAVGDHTYPHPRKGRLSMAAQRAQLLDQGAALRRAGAPSARASAPSTRRRWRSFVDCAC